MPHPDTVILASLFRFGLTPEETQCIVRVANLLNDLHFSGTGTATEEDERNQRLDAALTRIRTEDHSLFSCRLIAAKAQGFLK